MQPMSRWNQRSTNGLLLARLRDRRLAGVVRRVADLVVRRAIEDAFSSNLGLATHEQRSDRASMKRSAS